MGRFSTSAMRKALLCCILTAVSLATSGSAFACGSEPSATTGWSLDHFEYSETDALPFLSPGNDNRVNMLYLMSDANNWVINSPKLQPETPFGARIYSPALFSMSQLVSVFSDLPVTEALGCSRNNKWKTSFLDDGEGSRCKTIGTGVKAFADALEQEPKVSPAERQALTSSREQLLVQCDAPQSTNVLVNSALSNISNPSAMAKDFALYLAAASAFYEGKFDDAHSKFTQLKNSENKWVSETSLYMIGRTYVNKSQAGAYDPMDNTAAPKIKEKDSLPAAEKALNEYISKYPEGHYAASARGMIRRVYWLGEDKSKLSNEYAWQFGHMRSPQANTTGIDLVYEMDAKLFMPGNFDSHDAYLLAIQDLMKMRSGEDLKAEFSTTDLDKQAVDFKGHEDLLNYLRAAQAYYVAKDYGASLRFLGPGNYTQLNPPYLAFSREILRGQILMTSKSYEQSIEHWQKLMPLASGPWQKEAVELGLAISWERLGTVNKIFEAGTRISSPRIRAIILRYVAGPILLREAIDNPQSAPWERNLARFVLLFKESTRGQYVNFIKDYAPNALTQDEIEAPTNYSKSAAFNWPGQSGQYPCPKLINVIQELRQSSQSPHGLLCLGDFIRTENLDDFENGVPEAEELAGGKSIYPGAVYSRGEVYKEIIGKPGVPERDQAYALYRSINCYAPTGHNQCGGVEVSLNQRKQWFDTLKAKHSGTGWAKSLKYYW